MTTNKINNVSSSLQVDGINISGSTISTTTTDTDLKLSPNGSGKVTISGAYSLPTTDGTANQVLQNDGAGNISFVTGNTVITNINIRVFTSSGTYTPTSGMKQCIIELVGGGGGGGGTSATSSGRCSGGAGGGGGGYAKGLFSAATIGASQTVTIGAGGSGGNGGSSTAGGTTSVGSLISATGGSGVDLGLANTAHTSTGGDGGVGTGGFINSYGTPGEPAYGGMSSGNFAYNHGGAGGASVLGSGGYEQTIIPTAGFSASANGHSAPGYGGGGGGATTIESSTARTGGNGNSGIVIITEYI